VVDSGLFLAFNLKTKDIYNNNEKKKQFITVVLLINRLVLLIITVVVMRLSLLPIRSRLRSLDCSHLFHTLKLTIIIYIYYNKSIAQSRLYSSHLFHTLLKLTIIIYIYIIIYNAFKHPNRYRHYWSRHHRYSGCLRCILLGPVAACPLQASVHLQDQRIPKQ